MCEYCQHGKPLTIGSTNDKGITIIYPNFLEAYGYDINGADSNGLLVRIKYCPMCGMKIEPYKPKLELDY